MDKRIHFNKNDPLFQETKDSVEVKEKYKSLFEIDKRIRVLVQNKQMLEDSFKIISQILLEIRLLIGLHILPDSKKINVSLSNNGFKSNTDFNYARYMQDIECIKEKVIKNEMVKIIKDLKKPMGDAEKELIILKKKNQIYGCRLICPYCKEEYIKEFGADKNMIEDEFIEQCPNCRKEYRVLEGKVTIWKGRGTGVASYGLPEYTVRIKNGNKEKVMIFNTKYNLLHTKIGDIVYFIFKKKFLSPNFSEKPFSMINLTSNTYSLI